MEIPVLSADLIMTLDKLYPLRNPSQSATLPEIQRAAGKRDVVEMLLTSLADMAEDKMKK